MGFLREILLLVALTVLSEAQDVCNIAEPEASGKILI